MKKLGIIGAMQEEVDTLIKMLDDKKCEKINDLEFFIGMYSNTQLIVVRCGVGKVNSAMCTQLLIDKFNPDAIINIGVAGAVADEVNIGDTIEVQFNIEKYNGQREDYQFTLHTLKGEIVRIVENNEKVNLVGCKITEGREEVEKFVAMKQREKNKVGRKTNDLISMFVGKEGKKEE